MALEGGYSAVAVYRGAVGAAPAGGGDIYSQLKKENIEILPYTHIGHFHSFPGSLMHRTLPHSATHVRCMKVTFFEKNMVLPETSRKRTKHAKK